MHRLVGGSGLTDIEDYYTAGILGQIKQASTHWGEIEWQTIPGKNLITWLYSVHPKTKIPLHLPKTILLVVQIWRKFTHMAPLNIPLQTLKLLIPDLTIHKWSKYDSILLSDLTQDGHIKLFHLLISDLKLGPGAY